MALQTQSFWVTAPGRSYDLSTSRVLPSPTTIMNHLPIKHSRSAASESDVAELPVLGVQSARLCGQKRTREDKSIRRSQVCVVRHARLSGTCLRSENFVFVGPLTGTSLAFGAIGEHGGRQAETNQSKRSNIKAMSLLVRVDLLQAGSRRLGSATLCHFFWLVCEPLMPVL